MKNKFPVVLGVVGAALGYLDAMLVLGLTGFGNRADPIMSGVLVLAVLAPIGALISLMLGAKLGMAMRGGDSASSLVANSLKSLAVVVSSVAVLGGGYYVYAMTTATPWLNPNAATPLLQFEVRLPAGVALPAARDIQTELQTNLNRMPGELRQLRTENGRQVIAGEVELAFRTANRQLAVNIAGQPPRVYRIGLTDKAPHAPALGAWQTIGDGSEIRYRAKWPGQS